MRGGAQGSPEGSTYSLDDLDLHMTMRAVDAANEGWDPTKAPLHYPLPVVVRPCGGANWDVG